MKKITLSIIILCVILSLFTSCMNSTDRRSSLLSNSLTSESTDNLVSYEEPPLTTSAYFSSFDELGSTLNNWISDENIETILANSDEKSATTFKNFAEKRKEDNSILIPMIDNKNIVLRNEEGYPNITLFSAELYDQPWIWYHCRIDDIDLIVKIMYIDDDTLLTDINSNDVSWLIKQLAPSAPNIDNYESFTNYEKISLIETDLKNTVSKIMISSIKNDPRHFYKFVYQNILVSIQSSVDLNNTDIFSKLSFDELKLQ